MDSKPQNSSNLPASREVESKIEPYLGARGDLAFVVKRTERLASALYLITGFFDDKEPLKWKIRTLGSDLLSVAVSLRDTDISSDKVSSDLRGKVLEVDELLSLARSAGMLSSANYEIISGEFANLLAKISQKTELPREYFSVRTHPSERSRASDGGAPLERETFKSDNAAGIGDTRNLGGGSDSQMSVSDKVTPRQTSHKGQNTRSYSRVPSAKKGRRQEIILDLVRKQKEIMIRDVIPHISGCSEKTIQRELAGLVEAGVLKKEGDKRWSRYSLA